MAAALVLLAMLAGAPAGCAPAAPGRATATASLQPVVSALVPGPSVTPSPEPAPTLTPSPSPSPTATPTPTPTATLTPTPTHTPTPPGPTPDGQARRVRVPILMYHYISEPPPGADAVRRDLSVSPVQFEEHLFHLQQAGYTSITLLDLVLHLANGRPLPPKPVILTFDDGYDDNYVYAFPLLRQYGFRGTFFVITGYLDEGRAGYLTWQQAAEMQAAGMEIEAHSVSHPDLRGLSAEGLRAQVVGASQAISSHLDKPARFFCYPSGRYDARTIAALQAAGYWGAVTTQAGVDHDSGHPFELKRVRIHGNTGLAGLQALLAHYLE